MGKTFHYSQSAFYVVFQYRSKTGDSLLELGNIVYVELFLFLIYFLCILFNLRI